MPSDVDSANKYAKPGARGIMRVRRRGGAVAGAGPPSRNGPPAPGAAAGGGSARDGAMASARNSTKWTNGASMSPAQHGDTPTSRSRRPVSDSPIHKNGSAVAASVVQ